MSRLIDADTLKVSITRYAVILLAHKILPTTKDAIKEIISDICFAIDAAPTVDAVEVVRCKDCEYWICGTITNEDEFIPPKCGKYQQMVGHSASDYCSLGEKVTG